ncbi:hypothetical protein KAH55_01800 [bacterium]|nr:hypothetical protein [bacterium]
MTNKNFRFWRRHPIQRGLLTVLVLAAGAFAVNRTDITTGVRRHYDPGKVVAATLGPRQCDTYDLAWAQTSERELYVHYPDGRSCCVIIAWGDKYLHPTIGRVMRLVVPVGGRSYESREDIHQQAGDSVYWLQFDGYQLEWLLRDKDGRRLDQWWQGLPPNKRLKSRAERGAQ